MEFIGRKRELEILKSQLESGHAVILLYGRRSLGKTWLLRQAMKDLDGVKIQQPREIVAILQGGQANHGII